MQEMDVDGVGRGFIYPTYIGGESNRQVAIIGWLGILGHNTVFFLFFSSSKLGRNTVIWLG